MPPKRKRQERQSSDGSRPSPHRPSDMNPGQYERDQDSAGRGGSRGGRGGRRSERNSTRPQPPAPSSNPPSSSQNTNPSAQRPPSSSSQHPPAPAPTPTRQRPQAPTPQNASAMPSSSRLQSNYRYDNLDGQKINRWTEGGRQEVIQHGIQSRLDVDLIELSSLFQEFLHSVIDGRLQPTDAGECVKEILGDESHEVIKDSFTFEPHTLLLDTVSIVTDNDPTFYRPDLRDFLNATGVSPALMREILDATLLNQLSLIRDSFVKLGIRHSTNLLYRQANYNLLREETEGYSKLVTELYTTSGTRPPTAEVVRATFEKVKGLIGTFDLDVGRVLDVILDVFAAVLIKQFRFFIKLLRASSWWPRSTLPASGEYIGGLPTWALPDSPNWQATEEEEAIASEERRLRDIRFWDRARQIHIDAFFELGGRTLTDAERQRIEEQDTKEDSGTTIERHWMSITKTMPPRGNKTAAQLLGFKLRFYASTARDPEDVLPANLLYLAALLIKVGFISICDLYPHLWPSDEGMEELKTRTMHELEEKERESRAGGGKNALMMAGALPDDTPALPSATSRAKDSSAAKPEPQAANGPAAADEKAKLPEPMEQKVALLKCLLTIGAIPESLFILGRFPWIPEAFPSILDLLHRILNQSINKVYAECRPTATKAAAAECPPRNIATVDQTGAPKGTVHLGELAAKRFLRWPYPDKNDTNENQSYRFYWDEWVDNVPVCQTVDDVFTLCGTLLNVSGVNIGKDESLLAKLATIGAKSLAEDRSEANVERWKDLLRRLLVPSLSLTNANSSSVNLIWNLLSTFPSQVRYTIYAEWYEGQISRLPAIRAAFARTRLKTLSTMKRLSLTNLSEMAKTLAKTSYSSPGVVFKVALDQIEAYANLIEAFVECAKYFTDLAYDVLVWSLMSSLGGKQRSRTQESSVLLTSKWLQALSRFSGKVFRRYPVMTPTPLIRYVNHQLYQGNSTDLIILKELISSMGGVVPVVDFTDDQIMAMAGGEILRQQTLITLHDRRFDSVKSSKRLMKALIDSGLTGQLLINIAQYRQAAIFQVPEDEAHIKYLSSLVDDSHQILVQYLDLLRSNLEPTAFDSHVPSIGELMSEHGLDVGLAFLIGRASISHSLSDEEARSRPQQTLQPDAQTEPAAQGQSQPLGPAQDDDDVDMVEMPAPDVPDKPVGAATSTGDSTAKEADQGVAGAVSVNGTEKDVLFEVVRPIIESIQPLQDEEFWKSMAPEFYVLFWALQLGDLFVPDDRYQKEEDRAFAQAKEITRDRSDLTRVGITKKEEKHKALTELVVKLNKEKSQHRKISLRNKSCMIQRSEGWFPQPLDHIHETSDAIIEQCLFPRVLVSASDAEYCHRMVRFMHNSGTPNFQLMSLYDCIFNTNRIRSMIFTCTVRETEQFGRFLKCTLGDLSRWHKDKSVYEKEAISPSPSSGSQRPLIGFATEFDDDGKPKTFLDHAQFRDLLYTWHKNLNIALKSCLGGMEWMHIRNAITILKSVLDFFPAVDFMAHQFTRQLNAITEREAASKTVTDSEEGHRVDLSVAAQTALSELQRRKSKWVMVQGFRSNMQPGDIQQETAKPAEPANATTLRATASEFKPALPSRSSKKPSAADEEESEVKDGEESRQPTSKPISTHSTRPQNESLPAKPNTSSGLPPRVDRPPLKQDTGHRQAASGSSLNTPSKADALSKAANLPDRVPHGLPSRPDVPLPGHFTPDRFGQLRGREPRDARDGRVSTPHEPSRDARDGKDVRETRDAREPREQSRDARDSRAPEGPRLDRPRDLPDTERHADAQETPGNRDAAPRPDGPSRRSDSAPSREPRSSQHERTNPPGARGYDNRSRGAPPASNGPPTGPSAPSRSEAVEPPMNPERAALLQGDVIDRPRQDVARGGERGPRQPEQDRTSGFHPSRIPGGPKQQSRDEGRERAPQPPPQPPQRTHSPKRREQPDNTRDDSRGRQHPSSDHRSNPKDNRSEQASSGPNRNENNRERDGDDRPTEADHEAKFTGGPRPEPEHSRPGFNDPNYGRLNSKPIPNVTADANIPSGPRGRGGRGGMRQVSSVNNIPARSDGRFVGGDVPSNTATPADRQPPMGGRSSGRGWRGQAPFEPATTPGANPMATTPGSGAGHGRNRLNNGSSTPATSSPAPGFPASNNNTPGMHPDRLAQIKHTGGPAQPSPQTPPTGPNQNFGRSSLPGTGNQERPMGMPNMGSAPRAPSNHFSGSPSMDGAGFPGRTSRSEGRRQLAALNNTLQQAQGSGSLRRTNSGRSSMVDSDAQVLTGGSPVATPTHAKPETPRQEWPAERGPATTEGAREGERPRRERDRSERSGRPSRRSSRERDRDRERDRGDRERERSTRETERSPERERESRDSRNYRERRSGPSSGQAPSSGAREEREPSRRSGRDASSNPRDQAPPPPPASHGVGTGVNTISTGRDSVGGSREARPRGDANPGRGEEWARGGGHRIGGRDSTSREGPRGEDRREQREERSRKRRSEEGMGPPANERGEKRQRR